MTAKRVLVVDIGGNNVKVMASSVNERRKAPSGPELGPKEMIAIVADLTAGWSFDCVSLGLPTAIRHNRPVLEPHNLGKGWVAFDYGAGFDRPTKVFNDAAMQALGSYESGTLLFLGLGTGLGAALVVEGTVVPLEVAHLPYRKDRTFEDNVGRRGLDRLGPKKWQERVFDVVERLRNALVADEIVLGGGNAKLLTALPPRCRLGHNDNAFIGGFRLWEPTSSHRDG